MKPGARLLCPALLLPTIFLAACMPDLRSEHPPQRIYWLETVEVPAVSAGDVQVSVVPGLDTDRIRILQKDRRLNYYAGAYWPGNLGTLLESLLARSLNADQEGPVVEVLVERFFAVESGEGIPPDIELGARIRLLRDAGGELRCAFDSRSAAGGTRLRDIVAGHQARIDELTRAIARMLETGDCA